MFLRLAYFFGPIGLLCGQCLTTGLLFALFITTFVQLKTNSALAVDTVVQNVAARTNRAIYACGAYTIGAGNHSRLHRGPKFY